MIKDFFASLPAPVKRFWMIGLVLRLIALFFVITAPDYVGYRLPIAECITSGKWLYCECAYNHTPLYPYLSGLMNWFSGGHPHLQGFLITLPLGLGDALVPLAIFAFFRKIGKEGIAATAAMIYALNPIALIEVGIAHWDGFTTFFLLLSLMYMHEDKLFKSGLAAGFGVLLKQFPLAIVLFSFVRNWNFKKAFILGVITVGVVVLGFLPFILKCPETFVQNLLGHPLWKGAASTKVGIGTIKDLFEQLSLPGAKMIWLAMFVLMIGLPAFKVKESNYIYYVGLVMVTLAWFTFVTHRQLLVWSMPFVIMLTLERKQYLPFVFMFVGYAIRIIKPHWTFGLIHLGVGVWYYIAFLQTLLSKSQKTVVANE